MTYGVKVIHTQVVGEDEKRFYEELILKVEAKSFDEAYEKAERYMQDYACDYTNVYGKRVKTLKIEAVNCFLAFDAEGNVQEIYSSTSTNSVSLKEDEYYAAIASACEDEELYQLRDKDFNQQLPIS